MDWTIKVDIVPDSDTEDTGDQPIGAPYQDDQSGMQASLQAEQQDPEIETDEFDDDDVDDAADDDDEEASPQQPPTSSGFRHQKLVREGIRVSRTGCRSV